MSPKMWFRLLGLSCLLIVVGFVVPALTQDEKGRSHALLIGVKDYNRATLGKLNYTENDVEELAKVLDRPGSPFYKNVRVLTCTRGKKDRDDAPTAANIAKGLAALVKGKKSGDTVLVALAGHGIQLSVRDPKNKGKEKGFAYFCPQDADLPGADYETGRHEHMVLLSDLLGDLGDCGAGTKLLLMDACRNERTARSLRLNKELVPDGVAALFSCKTGQFAFESSKLGKGHGVFFHHVIEALKGEAKDKQGRVTWSRLVEHVTDKVTEDVPTVIGEGASQTPHEIKNFAGRSPVLVSGLKSGDSRKDKDGGTKVVKEDKLPKTLTIEDKDSGFSMEFVLIPATGEKGFMMGSTPAERKAVLAAIKEKEEPDWLKAESPRHNVVLTRPFYLGKYEVTQKQYKALVGSNPSYFSTTGGGKDKVKGENTDNFPVETVSWKDAQAFLSKLAATPGAKKIRGTVRLPTEAEWEYSCRGGPDVKEAFTFKKPSNSIHTDQANYDGNYPFGGADKGKYLARTSAVDTYDANPFGLYDMHGNVWEWSEDAYDGTAYTDKGRRDPLVLKGLNRVFRGGSWDYDGRGCRSANRNGRPPEYRSQYLGFRAALVPSVKE